MLDSSIEEPVRLEPDADLARDASFGERRARNTVIESLGVYLPERVLTTEELMRMCRPRPRLPRLR